MSRKFVYYLDGLSRSIVITDKENDMSLDEASRYSSEMMIGDKISKFETKTDILLVRPNEIKAIHIIDDYNDSVNNTIDDKNLQAFIPDIDLGDIVEKEEPENIISMLDVENKENEQIEKNISTLDIENEQIEKNIVEEEAQIAEDITTPEEKTEDDTEVVDNSN